jgi:cytochrome b involved in lipid metabolism
MDWAALTGNLKQPDLQRYTLEDVSKHNTREDCWIIYRGRVYDATRYLPFHPGGKTQLMRGAGKDCTELVMKIHSWINVDRMLEKCLVGYLQ